MIIYTCDMQNNPVQSTVTLQGAPDGQTNPVTTSGSLPAGACNVGPANYQQLQPSTTYNPSVHTGS
jgi:hypothetical protein